MQDPHQQQGQSGDPAQNPASGFPPPVARTYVPPGNPPPAQPPEPPPTQYPGSAPYGQPPTQYPGSAPYGQAPTQYPGSAPYGQPPTQYPSPSPYGQAPTQYPGSAPYSPPSAPYQQPMTGPYAGQYVDPNAGYQQPPSAPYTYAPPIAPYPGAPPSSAIRLTPLTRNRLIIAGSVLLVLVIIGSLFHYFGPSNTVKAVYQDLFVSTASDATSSICSSSLLTFDTQWNSYVDSAQSSHAQFRYDLSKLSYDIVDESNTDAHVRVHGTIITTNISSGQTQTSTYSKIQYLLSQGLGWCMVLSLGFVFDGAAGPGL